MVVTTGEVPVGQSVWRYADGSKQVDRNLTVFELSADEADAAEVAIAELAVSLLAETFTQADRVAGLQIHGLVGKQWLTLQGVFTRDRVDPISNLRPHYSTQLGGHLYHSLTVRVSTRRRHLPFVAMSNCSILTASD